MSGRTGVLVNIATTVRAAWCDCNPANVRKAQRGVRTCVFCDRIVESRGIHAGMVYATFHLPKEQDAA